MIVWLAVTAAADPLVDALAAELARTPQLELPPAEAPYFVGYSLFDAHHVTIEATLGGVVRERAEPGRTLGVSVRVGSPAEDNGNFSHGNDPDGFGSVPLVLGEAPDAARQLAWLATDRQYKDAVEHYARKQSARRNQPPRERPPEFTLGEAHVADAAATPPADPAPLRALAVQLSERFLAHPDVEWSRVWVGAETGRRVALDTGGTRVASPLGELDVRVVGCARSPDGEAMCDHVLHVVSTPDQLPPEEALVAEVDALAARLEAWRLAPRAEDEWVGPVLFEGDAAVEVVRRLLVPALVGTAPWETATQDFSRVTVADGGLGLKRRVLPPGWGVVDDPGADPARPSSFTHDDEGVPAQRLSLVEDGLVRDLLMSRVPGDDLQQSNGHARFVVGSQPRAAPSNLVVAAEQERSDKKLLRQALALARTYDLDHVMIVRRVADTEVGSSQFRTAFRASTTERTDLPAPVELVKRYADGREEVVRGLTFRAVDRRLLRDVVAAGPATTRTVLYGGSGPTGGLPVTLTAPDLLVAEVELVPMEGAAARPPRVPSPLAER